MTGYDWHVMRDLPPAHGSGKEPMYGSMVSLQNPTPTEKLNTLKFFMYSVLTHIIPVSYMREKMEHIIGYMLVRTKTMLR